MTLDDFVRARLEEKADVVLHVEDCSAITYVWDFNTEPHRLGPCDCNGADYSRALIESESEIVKQYKYWTWVAGHSANPTRREEANAMLPYLYEALKRIAEPWLTHPDYDKAW